MTDESTFPADDAWTDDRDDSGREPTVSVENVEIEIESGRVCAGGEETTVGGRTVEAKALVPQFSPSDLSGRDADRYAEICEIQDTYHGVVVLEDEFTTAFELGDELPVEAAHARQGERIEEIKEIVKGVLVEGFRRADGGD